jgi:hypothetical protein
MIVVYHTNEGEGKRKLRRGVVLSIKSPVLQEGGSRSSCPKIEAKAPQGSRLRIGAASRWLLPPERLSPASGASRPQRFHQSSAASAQLPPLAAQAVCAQPRACQMLESTPKAGQFARPSLLVLFRPSYCITVLINSTIPIGLVEQNTPIHLFLRHDAAAGWHHRTKFAFISSCTFPHPSAVA